MKLFDKIHLFKLTFCPIPMKSRSAIKKDLFASDRRREKIDHLDDTLLAFEEHINFAALAQEWIG
jgi:IS5 family transposase